MERFSGGMVKAALHRVVPPPGKQFTETRYSVVYLCRPEHHVILKNLTAIGSENDDFDVVDAKTWMNGNLLDLRVGINQRATEVSVSMEKH